jgi:gliding motility-associated-like protein
VTTTEHGCTDTANTQVDVLPDYYMFIPNAFTPNEDGRNDVFKVTARGIFENSFEMRIFNRWGQEIYYSSDIYEGWSGKFKDKNAECSTYVYDIRFMDYLYKKHQMTGKVTLLY